MNKKLGWYLIAGLLGAAGLTRGAEFANAKSPEPAVGITIRVFNYANINPDVLLDAKKVAEGILRNAGVAIKWIDHPIELQDNQPVSSSQEAPDSEKDSGCNVPVLYLSILPENMAIAYHLPENRLGTTPGVGANRNQIVIFSSNAKKLTKQMIRTYLEKKIERFPSLSLILGYAIAHEVGHALGNESHSAAGIMRADWRLTELRAAMYQELGFTPREAETIRADVIRRVQHSASAQSAKTCLLDGRAKMRECPRPA
jgi:hypothetical protein